MTANNIDPAVVSRNAKVHSSRFEVQGLRFKVQSSKFKNSDLLIKVNERRDLEGDRQGTLTEEDLNLEP
jgi:hypothetical protein